MRETKERKEKNFCLEIGKAKFSEYQPTTFLRWGRLCKNSESVEGAPRQAMRGDVEFMLRKDEPAVSGADYEWGGGGGGGKRGASY